MFKAYFFPRYNTLFTKTMFSPVQGGLFSSKPAFKNYNFNQLFTPLFPPSFIWHNSSFFMYFYKLSQGMYHSMDNPSKPSPFTAAPSKEH